MSFFGRKPSFCSICNKHIEHKHKPKREWDVEGHLCGDCYIDQMQKHYDLSIRQKCVMCKIEKNIPDLWEPKFQWDMKGFLCKACFDKKEVEYNNSKTFCRLCGKKLGIIRYNPKRQWSLQGQLCKDCWDSQKARLG